MEHPNSDTTWYRRREIIIPILLGIIVAIVPWVWPMNFIVMLICWLILIGCIEWLIFILVSRKLLRKVILVAAAILLIIGGFYRVREQWTKDHPVLIKESPSIGEQPKQPPYKEEARRLPSKTHFNMDSKVEVKLIFKDSPLFTPERKRQITIEIDAFRKYLIGLGFDVPKEMPPIGTFHGKGFQSAYSGSLGNNLPFNADIYIGDEAIDDPTSWKRAYAYYFFTVIFDRHSQKDAGLKFRKEWIIHIFLDYFANSYSNKRPKFAKGIDEWVNALWDIRDSCGQDFTDRALFYTSEVKIEAEEKIEKNFKNFEKDFNKDFSLRFLEGAWVVDNNLQNRPKIGEILRRHNLL
jgi:hypothetical protein